MQMFVCLFVLTSVFVASLSDSVMNGRDVKMCCSMAYPDQHRAKKTLLSNPLLCDRRKDGWLLGHWFPADWRFGCFSILFFTLP